MTTVEELQARLRSPRSVVREDDLDPAHELNPTTVFRSRPDGTCETWVRELGVPVHHQVFDSEAAAVADAEGRIFGTSPQPGSVRTPPATPPTTVEELKDALAALGRDPDTVTRAEVLREAPKPEGLTVVETRADGSVTTYVIDRGQSSEPTGYADEAGAVAALAGSMLRPSQREVSDLDVERMQVRADKFRDLVQATR